MSCYTSLAPTVRGKKKTTLLPASPNPICAFIHTCTICTKPYAVWQVAVGGGGRKNMKLMRTLVSMQASNCMRNKREYMQISGCGEFMHARKI